MWRSAMPPEIKEALRCGYKIFPCLGLLLLWLAMPALAANEALNVKLKFDSETASQVSLKYLEKQLTKEEMSSFTEAKDLLEGYSYIGGQGGEINDKSANEICTLAQEKKTSYKKLLQEYILRLEKETQDNLSAQKKYLGLFHNVKLFVEKPSSSYDTSKKNGTLALSFTIKNTTQETLKNFTLDGTFIHPGGEGSTVAYHFFGKIPGGLEPGESRQMESTSTNNFPSAQMKDPIEELTALREAKAPPPIYLSPKEFGKKYDNQKPRHPIDKTSLSQGAKFSISIQSLENGDGKFLVSVYSFLNDCSPPECGILSSELARARKALNKL